MSLSSIIILLLIGLCAGVLSGFVGVGGGMIIVPALVFFLGFSQHMAQGTSLAMMLPPIGLLAVYNYYQTGNINIKAALIISASFFIGAYLGSRFSLVLDEKVVRKIFGVVMLLASLKLLFAK